MSAPPDGLARIVERLDRIAALLADPETPHDQAVELAREAADLVSEALRETERAVASLEQED